MLFTIQSEQLRFSDELTAVILDAVNSMNVAFLINIHNANQQCQPWNRLRLAT